MFWSAKLELFSLLSVFSSWSIPPRSALVKYIPVSSIFHLQCLQPIHPGWHDDKLNPVFDSTKDCYSRWNNSPQPREICSGRGARLNLAGELLRMKNFQDLLKTMTKNFVGTGSEMLHKFVTSEISTGHFDDISILMWPGSGFACLQCRDLIGSTMAHSLVAYNPRPGS